MRPVSGLYLQDTADTGIFYLRCDCSREMRRAVSGFPGWRMNMGDSGKTTERKKRDRGLRFQTNTGLILFFLKGSYLYFLAGAVFACLVALFDLIIPRMIQFTVDAVIGGNTGAMPGWAAGFVNRFGGAGFLSAHLWAAALAIAGAAALGAVCRYCFKVSNAKGAETFVRRMRDQLFSHIMSLPYAWHGVRATRSSAVHRMWRRSKSLSRNS